MQSRKKQLLIIAILASILAVVIIHDRIIYYQGIKESVKVDDKDSKNEKKGIRKGAYNLPLITIETHGKKITDGERVLGEMKLYNKEDGNKLTDKPSFKSHINIRIRGNTTRLVPKKQYSFDLLDNDNKGKNPEKLLGMNKSSDWILNAPFEDTSLLRNHLAYDVGAKIMEYSPKSEYCEVFVDLDNNGIDENDYRGVYLLIEKIQMNENKVNIHETDPKQTETSFIVQKNNNKAGDVVLDNYGMESYLYDYPIVVEYPTKTLTKAQQNYISEEISKFEKALYDDPSSGDYEKYIDVNSFVDYYIINEFFNNPDAGILSTYCYKDYGGKIKAGPIWDFNASLGNSNVLSPYYEYEGFFMNSRPWFDKLLEDKDFVNKVIKRYRELRHTFLSDKYLIDSMNKYISELGPAIKRNFDLWPFWMCNQFEMFKGLDDVFLPLGQDPKKIEEFLKQKKNKHYLKSTANMGDNYEETIEKIKVFIKNRGKWLDNNISKLNKFAD